MSANPCKAAAHVGMDIIRQIRDDVFIIGMDVDRTATLKIYAACEEHYTDPWLREKILTPLQRDGFAGLSVVDHGRSSEFSGETVRDGVTVSTSVFLRQAGCLVDTTTLNGPGLVADVIGDITSSGGTVRSCMWQVIPGDDGEPAGEHVWASFEDMAYTPTPVCERLKIAGWEAGCSPSDEMAWLIHGAHVATKFYAA